MNYPLISEYIEAIKAAEDNFEELSYLRPVLGDDGMPVMTSGNFAVVFKMQDVETGKFYALKCFTKEQEGRAEAYHQIAEELKDVDSPYLTSVRYLDKELFVDTDQTSETEFPVLLMEWVEGIPLDVYIHKQCASVIQYNKETWSGSMAKYSLELLASNFRKLAIWLKCQPFAHGDLKPDNILVQKNGSLVLVDYDGMYVPSMKGQENRELGSIDFRHPQRTEKEFDEDIDNFSIASILLSLQAISYNIDFYAKHGAPDRLLFSANDYRDIACCELIKDLLKIENKQLNQSTYHFIEELLMIFDFLPFNGLNIQNVYGYKKNGKFIICDDNFNDISDEVLEVYGNTIAQYELEYSLNINDLKKHVTLFVNKQARIAVKISPDTTFYVPRLFTPFEYCKVDILVKGDIFNQLVGDNYINQDCLILQGKRYSQIKYLLSFDSHHLLGKFDINGDVKEYILIGPNEKVCFYTKIKDSFILMASQYGGFDLIGLNNDDIWYFNYLQGLKKYKKDERIDLAKAHVHKDRYAKLIITIQGFVVSERSGETMKPCCTFANRATLFIWGNS